VGELAEHQAGEFPEHFSLGLGEFIERRHVATNLVPLWHTARTSGCGRAIELAQPWRLLECGWICQRR
jgi:hypothetical protein